MVRIRQIIKFTVFVGASDIHTDILFLTYVLQTTQSSSQEKMYYYSRGSGRYIDRQTDGYIVSLRRAVDALT